MNPFVSVVLMFSPTFIVYSVTQNTFVMFRQIFKSSS